MANVITSFLVGIGYDTQELRKGEREISTSMEGVKSLASTTGAALASAFIGVGATADTTARRVNELRLNTNLLYTSTQYVNDYGNAIRSLGGDVGTGVKELQSFENILSNLRQKGTDASYLELPYYGVNPEQMKALQQSQSGGEFAETLSKIFPTLDREQQQGVANTLGLSPASVELLRKGNDGYRQVLNNVHEVAGLSDDLIEKSREYNAAINQAQLSWEGIANTISESVLPDMTSVVNKGNEILNSVIKPMVERNPEQTGAGLALTGTGLAGTVAGPLLSAIGLGGAGAAVGALGLPVTAVGLGTLGWGMNQQDVKNLTGYELPSYLWDKKVFDESQGDTAGGVLHSDSLLGRSYNAIFGDEPGTNNGPIEKAQQWAGRQGYGPMASDNSYNSAAAVGEAVAEKLYSVPLKATVNNNVDMRVELDGRALDSKITEVQQRNNQMTVDDMQSTTAR